MTKFLITGGAGFIGSNLAKKLSENTNNFITIVDDLSTGRIENIAQRPNVKFVKTDANKLSEVFRLFHADSFDYVFHYAAVVGVQRTLRNPLGVLRDLDGIRNILDLSKATGVKRVFFASSSEVYGEPVESPQHEERTPLNSRLPYAVVKNVGEAFFRSYKYEHGQDYTIFRFFNTYGPGQSTDFVMSKFLAAALSGSDITVYGNGNQTRTFCYINDNVEATINAIADKAALGAVINIGSDAEITINELADIIIQVTKSRSKIVHLPPLKEGDMSRRKPDATKMKNLLQRPLTPLETGLQRLLGTKTLVDNIKRLEIRSREHILSVNNNLYS